MKRPSRAAPDMWELEDDELIGDLFAGCGGASLGIFMATGRHPDFAINHSPAAVAYHEKTHPTTKHYCEDIWAVNPLDVFPGRRIGLLWASPDCSHFSRAKGGKPRDRNIRALADTLVHWCALRRPRMMPMENVIEFLDWGPLYEEGDELPIKKNGKRARVGDPIPERKGEDFRRFVASLRALGYEVEWRVLNAADYGAPTSRKRLYLIARCDGMPIVWPEPTHGPGRAHPHLAAATCIDWELPTPSIFMTRGEARQWGKERGCRAPKRPLAEKTMRRIARGVKKFVIDNPRPFVVPVTHAGDARVHDINDPMRTVTGAHRGEFALVQPYIMNNMANNVPRGVDEPLATALTGNHKALCVPVVTSLDHQSSPTASTSPASPLTTVTTKARHMVVAPVVSSQYGASVGRVVDEPLPTVTAGGGGKQALLTVTAGMVQTGQGERPGQAPRVYDTEKPLSTVVAGGQKHGLVSAYMARHFGGGDDKEVLGRELEHPVPTIKCRDSNAIVVSSLSTFYGTTTGAELEDPMPTATAGGNHIAEVRALITKFHGGEDGGRSHSPEEPLRTVDTSNRFGLVTINGDDYVIVDIGMRMLVWYELARAQGFPAWSIQNVQYDRVTLTRKGAKRTQRKWLTHEQLVELVGNSVAPPVACAIVRANLCAPADLAEAA